MPESGSRKKKKRPNFYRVKRKRKRYKKRHKINIYANIGSVGDMGYVLENDAGVFGLFRSEFLYIGEMNCQAKRSSSRFYKQVAQDNGQVKR